MSRLYHGIKILLTKLSPFLQDIKLLYCFSLKPHEMIRFPCN